MKKLTTLLLTVLFYQLGHTSPDDFIITVQTDHYGESGFNQFTIPTNPSEVYNYAVDCENDGVVEASNLTGDYTCEYDEIGEYTIRIIHDANTGLGFPSIQFGNPDNELRDGNKLIAVNQWGTGIWTNMAYAFAETINFHDQANDVPDFSQVFNMQSMFYNSKIENLKTMHWDVSSVTNMSRMFAVHDPVHNSVEKLTVLPDVSLWNISSVTNINLIFNRRASNMPDLSQWDTSSVTTMIGVFPIYDYRNPVDMTDVSQWDTSSVTNMAGLFYGATNIPDISQWDTSSVTDMRGMFYEASGFDLDLSNWDTSAVTDMDFMFFFASFFTVRADNWNTSNVTTMSNIFYGIYDANVYANNWDTSSVLNMDYIFNYVAESNINVSNWDFSQIDSMQFFFEGANNSVIDCDNWNTSSITDMNNLLNNASNVHIKSKSWDMSSVSTVFGMFREAKDIVIDTTDWDTSSFSSISLFYRAENIQLNTKFWNLSNVQSMNRLLNTATNISLDISQWQLPQVTTFSRAFNDIHFSAEDYESFLINLNLHNQQAGGVLDISHAQYCSTDAENARSQLIARGWIINDAGKYCHTESDDFIITVTGDSFDIVTHPFYSYDYDVDCNNDGILEAESVVEDFTCNFSTIDQETVHTIAIKHDPNTGLGFPACYFGFGSDSENSDKLLLLNNWGTSRWQSMSYCFANMENILITSTDVPNFGEVTNFDSMFRDNTSIFSIDVSLWDTSSAQNMSHMFSGSNIRALDVTNWQTSNVMTMSNMFRDINVKQLNVREWDTSQVTAMDYMFSGSKITDLNLNTWGVSSVMTMNNMFEDLRLTYILFDNWDTSAVIDMSGMFKGSRISRWDISRWDTSNVTNMSHIFNAANISNIDIGQWDTSNVTDMSGMFQKASFRDSDIAFDIAQLNTAQVTDMSFMFSESRFTDLNLNRWNISSVSNMAHMFNKANPSASLFYPNDEISLTIDQWDTSNVSDMSFMFNDAQIDNLQLGQWEIPLVNDMTDIFTDYVLSDFVYDNLLQSFADQNIQSFVDMDVGGNHYCSQAAIDAKNDLITNSQWTIQDGGYQCPQHFIMTVKTDNAGQSSDVQFTIPTNPFENGYNYAVDCDNDGHIEADMLDGVYTCSYPEPGTYDIRIIHDVMSDDGFPAIYFNNSGDVLKVLSIKQWGSNIWKNMNKAFAGATNLTITDDADLPNLSSTLDMSDMFFGAKLSIDYYDKLLLHMEHTVTTVDMEFSAGNSTYCSLESSIAKNYLLNELNWSITDDGWQCYQAPESDLVFTVNVQFSNIKIDPTQLTDHDLIDYHVDCNNDGTFEHFNITGAVTCNYENSLSNTTQKIRIRHNLSDHEGFPALYVENYFHDPLIVAINQWGTGKWYSMEGLFQSRNNFWVGSGVPNTSELSTTASMFNNSQEVHISMNNWDMSQVVDMQGMFSSSRNEIDISLWDTSNVQNMSFLFNSAGHVHPGIANWDISSVTNMDNIFRNAPLSNELYDQILINFGSQNVNNGLTLDVGDTQYCNQEALDAKNHLINAFNWTIIDGGDCDFIFANGFE